MRKWMAMLPIAFLLFGFTACGGTLNGNEADEIKDNSSADKESINEDDGHGMIFEDYDGGLWLSLHSPNDSASGRNETPVFIPIKEKTTDWYRINLCSRKN